MNQTAESATPQPARRSLRFWAVLSILLFLVFGVASFAILSVLGGEDLRGLPVQASGVETLRPDTLPNSLEARQINVASAASAVARARIVNLPMPKPDAAPTAPDVSPQQQEQETRDPVAQTTQPEAPKVDVGAALSACAGRNGVVARQVCVVRSCAGQESTPQCARALESSRREQQLEEERITPRDRP